jgi:phosphate-selective porin OprO/OprP
MKEPFSLEQMTSSKYFTFMERSLPNTFVAGRNTGLLLHNSELEDRLTWAVGVFEDSDDFGDSFENFSDWNVTGRLTGLPWYADEGRKLLHLGFSYSHQFRNDEESGATVRYRERPESHITDARIVDTGEIFTDDVDLVNPELALVFGPFSFQTEYFYANLDTALADDPEFGGYYAYVSYFLMGEHRKYSPSNGYFSRTRPFKNFNL